MPSPTSGYINAYFGFLNQEIDTVEVPVGDNNRMSPPPQDRSQTEVFFNRRSRHFPLAAFYAPFSASSELTWELNGYSVTATSEDNRCRTEWITYEITILQDNPPPLTIIQTINGITQKLLGTSDDQVLGNIGASAPNFQRILMNVTTVEGSISPMAAIIALFGNTQTYDQYVLDLRSLGLVVVSIDTIETGLEKMGEEIGTTPPTSPGPSNPVPLPPPSSTPEASTPIAEPGHSSPIDDSHGPNQPQPQPPTFGEPSLFPSSAGDRKSVV